MTNFKKDGIYDHCLWGFHHVNNEILKGSPLMNLLPVANVSAQQVHSNFVVGISRGSNH